MSVRPYIVVGDQTGLNILKAARVKLVMLEVPHVYYLYGESPNG